MTLFSPVTLGILVLALVIIWRAVFWYREGQKLQQDGYLPPHPTFIGQWTLRIAAKLMTRLFIGPVKVLHRGKSQYNGRLHIIPNHQYPLDFAVVGTALPYGFRHLGTAGQMKGGLKGMLSAFVGFFAVHTEGGKATEKGGGERAVQAMKKALVRNKRSKVLTFGQGKLEEDNILRPEAFRTGAIRATQAACTEDGINPNEIAVLPMAVLYLRDARYASWFHRLVNKLGFKKFRQFHFFDKTTQNYGAVVSIGDPITVAQLPADPREAIELVRVKIDALLTEAKAWADESVR